MYPIDAITDNDKYLIELFFNRYQGKNTMKCSTDKFLSCWNKNKIKMFKLLSNNLSVSINIGDNAAIADKYIISAMLGSASDKYTFLNKTNYETMYHYINSFVINQYGRYNYVPEFLTYRLLAYILLHKEYHQYTAIFQALFVSKGCARDIFERNILAGKLVDWPDEFANITAQISKGMKYPKAVKKFMQLVDFHGDSLYTEWLSAYSDLRTNYCSDFSNTSMVLSIHPLDFLGMSHGNDWSTCMSWASNGCYHASTVEMMNSNNAIVAYVTNGKLNKDGRPNKLWRCLIFIDKDIIVNGKCYPFANTELKKIALKKIYELANQNFHWNYTYKLQRYHDMRVVKDNDNIYNRDTEEYFEEDRDCELKQHGIYLYMHGFYNDFAEDHFEEYYCYRNNVKKTRIITCSGPLTCACCGKILKEDNRYYNTEEYIGHSNMAICYDCLDKYTCCNCQEFEEENNIYTLKYVYHNFNGKYNDNGSYHYEKYVALSKPYKICKDCVRILSDVNHNKYCVYDKTTKKYQKDVDLLDMKLYNKDNIILIQLPNKHCDDVYCYIEDWINNGQIESES